MGELGLLYELALMSVIIGGGYWGWYFVTRRPTGSMTYGLMQLASAALCGLGLLGRKYDVPWTGVAGAIGVGAGTCLTIVGPLVRGLARRLAAAEKFGAAGHLLDIADLLAPGSGVPDEKALLGAMREIRDGRIEPTVDALTAAKERAPADAKIAIDERIAMLYLAAYRWDDAIAHAEANLFGAMQPDTSASPNVALRRVLGIAPPLYVELLGAYGRKGDLDRAARMLAHLEDVCTGRDDAAIWLHRGRLMFLALAGRVSAVRALVEPRRSRHMNPASRTYWIAVAHERRGEAGAAEAAYAKARSRSRGKPREMIDQALANLMHAKVAELSPLATEVVSRVEAAPVPAVVERTRPRGPWATRTLVVANLAVAGIIALAFGSTTEIGVLYRAGAMVRELVNAGEWWRLVACVFIHVGTVHLVFNMVGLYFIGRLCEDLFGGVRTVAIFAVAGITGSVASYLASPAGMSAGASGAIFGLLGALFMELTLHRSKHRAAWRRGMWGSIVLVAVAQLGLGFMYPIMDQWAHAAGLAGGAVAGAALSPNLRLARLGLEAARVIAIALAIAVVTTGVLVARTSAADSLSRGPSRDFTLGKSELHVTAPASWTGGMELSDPDHLISLVGTRIDNVENFAPQLGAYTAEETDRAKKDGYNRLEPAHDRRVPLPPGWEGTEMIALAGDPLVDTQRFRVVIAGSAHAVVSLYVPEGLAREAPAFFTKLLASIH